MWGIVLILGALLAIPAAVWMVWSVLEEQDAQGALMHASQVAYVLSVAAQAIGGIVALVWADRIVALSETAETPLRIGIDGREAQALTFAVVGVFVLVDGLQDAAAAAHVFWSKPDAAPAVSYMGERQGEGIIEALVQIAAGAVLILGRDPFVQGWMRLRTGRAHDLDDSKTH